MGFYVHFSDLILKCISTLSYKILINGQPSKSFALERGWKEKFLSRDEKEVLIKVVAHVIPSYIMSCYKLPEDSNETERLEDKFWWGKMRRERKIHWMS